MLRIDSRRVACGVAFAVGLVALAGTGSVRADQGCVVSTEQRALHARVLQTELMVAALQCQSHTEYNAFVRKYQAELVDRGKSLRGHYNQKYGGGGGRHLNALITRLANEASQRSMSGRVGFCQQAKLVFAEAQTSETTSFDRIAAKVASATGNAAGNCGQPSSIVGYGTASRDDPSAR